MKALKKFLLGFAAFAAMAILGAVCAGAETYGDYVYAVLDDGTIEITGYNGTDTDVTVPSAINGKTVTSIGDSSFKFNSTIESISIPGTVKSIGKYAFDKCTSLSSVNLPSSVTTLGNYSFNRCSSLKSIKIPSSVKSIGSGAFEECTALTSITIPNGVKTIDAATFSFCSSLESISIPDSITSIGNYAFQKCSRLSSITLPDSVARIGQYAFEGCTSLASITIPSSATEIQSSALGYYYNQDSSKYEILLGFKIYCYAGTQGEKYAQNNGIDYSIIFNTEATAFTDTTITLGWNLYLSADGYIIEKSDGSSWSRIITVKDCSITNYTVTGLTPATAYRFRVTPYKMNGSSISRKTGATTTAKTKPSPLAGLKAAAATNGTGIRLSWNKNTKTTGYIIESFVGTKWQLVTTLTNNSSSSYTVSGLEPSTAYRFRVTPYTKLNGTMITGTAATVIGKTAPTVLTGLKAAAATNGTDIKLSWNKNETATGYIIEKAVGSEWVRVITVTYNSRLSYTVTGLNASTSYRFRVTPYTALGSTIIRGAAATVIGKTAPSALSGLKAAATTDGTGITLSWDKNTTATGYIIEKEVGSSWVRVITVTNNSKLSYTVTGLDASTSYCFRVTPYTTLNDTIIRGTAAMVTGKTTAE